MFGRLTQITILDLLVLLIVVRLLFPSLFRKKQKKNAAASDGSEQNGNPGTISSRTGQYIDYEEIR